MLRACNLHQKQQQLDSSLATARSRWALVRRRPLSSSYCKRDPPSPRLRDRWASTAAVVSGGLVVGAAAESLPSGQGDKELHIVGAGSLATADEQVRISDAASGLTLSLGADAHAGFVQATTPGVQYETPLLNPHGAPVGIGTADIANVGVNGVTIYRSESARLTVTNEAGAAGLILGNRDSAGADNPTLISAANGLLFVGDGTSWTDADGGGFEGSAPDFTFDTANARLGIGVGYAPTVALDVAGDVNFGAIGTPLTMAFGGLYELIERDTVGVHTGMDFSVDISGLHSYVEVTAFMTHCGGGCHTAYEHRVFNFNRYASMIELHNTEQTDRGSGPYPEDNDLTTGGSWTFQRLLTGHNTHDWTSSIFRIKHIGTSSSAVYPGTYFIRIRATSKAQIVSKASDPDCAIDCSMCPTTGAACVCSTHCSH